MTRVANDEVLPARELFPGIVPAWANLPAELIVDFDLTRYGGIRGWMFAEYRRASLAEALATVLTTQLCFVMLRYTIVVRGAKPLLGWDLDAPLSRVNAAPVKRTKVQGVYPWDWEADPTLVQVYQHSPPDNFLGFARATYRPTVRLRVGGRTPREAIENWTWCAAPLRRQRKAVLEQLAAASDRVLG